MDKKIKLLGIVGSIRKESINMQLMKAVEGLLPQNVEIEIADISTIPLFNQDLESNFPDEAKTLKEKVKNADGIIFVTPEHNRSIPAALKNAIDWCSRPYGANAFASKK